MRISDWSSDVCSSDLDDLQFGSSAFHAVVVNEFQQLIEQVQPPMNVADGIDPPLLANGRLRERFNVFLSPREQVQHDEPYITDVAMLHSAVPYICRRGPHSWIHLARSEGQRSGKRGGR